MTEDRLPLYVRLRYWLIGLLIEEAGWFLRQAGKLSEDEFTIKQIENALRGMWDAGMWVQKIDGSSFEAH